MMGWITATVVVAAVVGTLAGASPPRGLPKDSSALLQERLHRPAQGPEDIVSFSDKSEVNAVCVECQLVVTVLLGQLDAGVAYDDLIQESVRVCVILIGLTEEYCVGFVPLIAPVVYHVLSTNELSPVDVCGQILQYVGCTSSNPARDWTVNITGEKPPVEPIVLPQPDAPKLKVLHLSDTHMDPLYSPGSNADCPEVLCCRNESGEPETEEGKAWFWGDYRHCGSPPWMLEDLLTNARAMHPDLDYVIWTGDVVPHNMWSTSREWNLRLVKETNMMIQDYFPDIPVFPVVGNHEISPIDQYPDPNDSPPELSANWLYNELAKQWSILLPDFHNSTVLHGGYYSVLVRPGFRIISFNSMFGYTSNVWLIENSQDPGGELVWLEAELGRAEAAGELVHLLGHIPPGLVYEERTWSREYNRIIVRYENIIRGQFFGHTHYDQFQVFHDGDRPIGVAYVAPSQTPWYYLNPAFRVYTVDGDRSNTTRLVLESETFIMNLTEAESQLQEGGISSPRWYKLYDARDLYGMESLLPSEWQKLAERMAQDRQLFDLYYTNYVSAGDPYLELGCDDQCYELRLCDMVTSNRNDQDHCHQLLRRKNKIAHNAK